MSDPTFRGERNAPWKDTETDLMAANLAYELGCKLLGQTAGEYVVATHDINGEVDPTTALVELVSNNLAGLRALQFAAGETNAVIEGKAHRIDEELFQYWVTITPTDPDSEMTALSADAYVYIPDAYAAAALVPDIILLDLRMPQIDGLGVLDRLVVDVPGVPIVMLTALGHSPGDVALL